MSEKLTFRNISNDTVQESASGAVQADREIGRTRP